MIGPMRIHCGLGILGLGLLCALAAGCTPTIHSTEGSESQDPLIRKAHALGRDGDKEGEIVCLNQALDRNPGLAKAHLELALLYHDYKSDYVRAVYHYSRYLELRPETEKKDMIEERIRKAKLSYGASLVDQLPNSDARLKTLQAENAKLKNELRESQAQVERLSAPPPTPTATLLPAPTIPATPMPAGIKPVARFSLDESALRGAKGGSAPPSGAARTYVVQPRDRLSTIAAKMYQDPRQWKKIYEANRAVLTSPEKLKSGQTLVIPDGD